MADKLVPANDVVEVVMEPIGLPDRRRQEMSLETFRAIENELLEETARVVHGIAAFAQIDPGAEGPPDEWVKELGYKAALERFRVAKAAWMCQSEAPVGLKYAQATYIGIGRIRAADKMLVQNTLNVGIVQVVDPKAQYPELEVEERK